jgi:hypothetical protein
MGRPPLDALPGPWPMTTLKDKLKRLTAMWPTALLAFGVLLTVIWTGALVWIAYYLFVIASRL